MARKRATPSSRSTQAAPPSPTPDTITLPAGLTGPTLPAEPHARFTLYNLLGKEVAWYEVRRVEIDRSQQPVTEKSVAHSIIIIDRSGSMTWWIEDLKDTLIKLLTLEEYQNFNLLVTLLSYSSQGDLQVHFQRTPISEIMERNSRHIQEIRKIRTTGMTCISQSLQLAGSLVQDSELTAITLHSDGYANDPSANTEQRSIEQMLQGWQERALFVNTIAYSDASDFRLLAKIANAASGTCVRAGSIREIFDSLQATSRLLGGQVTPPIEQPLPPGYDYQVFISRTSGKVNGAPGTLYIRGLKPEDDAAVYQFRKLDRPAYEKLKNVPVVQTGEAVVAFARAQLAQGALNTAKYALASTFDKTLFDRHARALTNLQVAALAQDLDRLLFLPGLLTEHTFVSEVPVHRKIALLTLVRLLEEHLEGFRINFEHLRQNYIRRGLRRVPGVRDAEGKLQEPWLKTDLADRDTHVRVSSFDINRNTANLNVLIPRRVRLVQVADGKPIDEVAGVKLDNLTIFNNYTLVGDGELNVAVLKVRISDPKLFARLQAEGVLEVEGTPATTTHDPSTDYTLRLDTLPLVPPFEGSVQLDGVFEQLAELKVLSSICTAHLKEEAEAFTAEQVEELRRHYLSKNLYLNFPTTTEYTDLQQALAEGTVDTRTSYKIDVGSRSILNLGKLHSANKCLERLYEVTVGGQKLEKPKFEDCLEGATFTHKKLSARTKVTKVDEFMRRLFDDFLGVAPSGAAAAVLERVGATELAGIVRERGKGKQPERSAYIRALTAAGKALDREADRLFNERVSPLVFYTGSTGALPDEIDARAQTAEEITAKYPDLSPSKDEQEGLFFEIGQAILTVYARREYYSRDRTLTGGANVAPAQPV